MTLIYEPRIVLDSVHSDSVNCLKFSFDGCFLASGGSDGRVVFSHRQSQAAAAIVACLERENTTISCLEWACEGHERLVVGDSAGYLVTIVAVEANFARILTDGFPAHKEEIRFLQFCTQSNTLASASKDAVKLWIDKGINTAAKQFGRSWKYHRLLHFPSIVDPTRPNCIVALQWLQTKQARDKQLLLAADMYKGVVIWDSVKGDILSHYSVQMPIGSLSTCYSRSNLRIATYDLRSGFDLYELKPEAASLQAHQHFDIPARESTPNIILPSTFAHDGRILVTSSPTGQVCLWDVSTGSMIHILDHQHGCVVQALSVYYDRTEDVFYIATGTSGTGIFTKVMIWSTREIEEEDIVHQGIRKNYFDQDENIDVKVEDDNDQMKWLIYLSISICVGLFAILFTEI